MRFVKAIVGSGLLLAVAPFALVLAQAHGVRPSWRSAPGLQNGDGDPGHRVLYVSEPVTPFDGSCARSRRWLILNSPEPGINPRLSLNNQADLTFRVAGGPDPLVPL
ncbi:MAG: hypothetical protein H6651_00105 [Ardenticatenales bacterium]|nr:hypothetical protein [Ardenticatenales bacterium]